MRLFLGIRPLYPITKGRRMRSRRVALTSKYRILAIKDARSAPEEGRIELVSQFVLAARAGLQLSESSQRGCRLLVLPESPCALLAFLMLLGRHGKGGRQRRDLHHRLDRMNRHGLTNLNRRELSGVQLEVVRLYRADGTLKEWFNPDAWISNIAYEGVRT
jgi:hypothetical protein